MEAHISEEVSHTIKCDHFHTGNLKELYLLDFPDDEHLKLLTRKWKDDHRNFKEIGRGILEIIDCLHETINFNDAFS